MKVSPLMGGAYMVFQNAGELTENRETSLRFAVADSKFVPRRFSLNMGILGHAVVRRTDGAVFTHLHRSEPSRWQRRKFGATRELDANAPASADSTTNVFSAVVPRNANTGNVVTFPTAFPRP